MKLTPAYIGGIAGQDVRTVEKLDLSKKEIKEMDDISCCVELKRLDLSQNQLSKVYGINFLKEITWLNLSSNKITSIVGLQMMTKLNVLNASDNQIERIDGLSTFTQLKALMLNKNKIAEMEGLGCLRELNTLVLSDNAITEVKGLNTLSKLKKLALSNNYIRVIPSFEKNFELQELRLNGNKILSIPDTIHLNPHIKILDLGKNLIKEWSDVEKLAKLPKLKSLTLAGNPLAEESVYRDSILTMLPNLKILDGKQISTELVRKRKAWAARWAAQHGKKDASGEGEPEAPHAEDGEQANGAERGAKVKDKRPDAPPAPKKAVAQEMKPAQPKAAGKRTREESEKEEGLKGRTQKKTRTEPQNEKPEPAAKTAKAAVKTTEQPSKKRGARDEVDTSKPTQPQAKKGRSETEKNKTTNELKKREAPTARANAAAAAAATTTTNNKKKPANKFDERSREMRATADKKKSAPKRDQEPEMEPVEEEKGEIERKLEEHVQLVTGNSGLLEVIKASDTPKSGGQQPTNKKGKGKAAVDKTTASSSSSSSSAKKVQSVLDIMGLTQEPEVGLGVGNAWV